MFFSDLDKNKDDSSHMKSTHSESFWTYVRVRAFNIYTKKIKNVNLKLRHFAIGFKPLLKLIKKKTGFTLAFYYNLGSKEQKPEIYAS